MASLFARDAFIVARCQFADHGSPKKAKLGKTERVRASRGLAFVPRPRDSALAPLFVMLEPRRSFFFSTRLPVRQERMMDPGAARRGAARAAYLARERPVHEEISRTFRDELDHHRAGAGRASPSTRALCLPRSISMEIRSWWFLLEARFAFS